MKDTRTMEYEGLCRTEHAHHQAPALTGQSATAEAAGWDGEHTGVHECVGGLLWLSVTVAG
jgi:hypothetical protein